MLLPDRQYQALVELRAACYDKRWPERPAWVRTRHLETARLSPFLRVLHAKGLIDRADPEEVADGAAMTRDFFWRINRRGQRAIAACKRRERLPEAAE